MEICVGDSAISHGGVIFLVENICHPKGGILDTNLLRKFFSSNLFEISRKRETL